jgi:hypothetical protein
MSEISVVVNGSTTINPTVGNGDTVNVTFSAAGDRGPRGDTGASGPANSLKIGTVVTGTDAAATITGTSPSQTLSLVLPQGATGVQGPQGNVGPSGPANSLSIGTVTRGDDPAATLTGTAPTQVLSLTLPKGDAGPTGAAGPATTVQVGTVTTAASSANAAITTVTKDGTVTLNFSIPRGADGTSNLADETPQPLGVASAGSATRAARADHVHATPAISYASLTGTPASFPPASHSHAVADVTGLQTALDSKQAVGNYATLVGGTIPSSQLPSFVDDVTEFANLAAFPATGETGKLFVAIDTRKLYRWSGSTYVEIAGSPGSTDSVTEGTTNLYFTTKRAADAAPVQSVNGKTGAVTIEAGGIAWSTVPATTTTTTTAGAISYDDNYLYVANATNQWRRVGVEDWTTPTISISVQPSNQMAVAGAATFSVTASATQNAELLYQWQRQAGGAGSWLNIATGLSATLSLADLSFAANNGDKYRVVITSGSAGTGGTAVNGWLPAVVVELTPAATLTSGEATLTISASISIIVQPQNVSLTNGTSATFSVSATTPGAGLSYQWQSSPDGTNWTNVSGATSASYSLTGLTETGYSGLRYRCVVSSSGYPDATSNAVTLTVAPISVTTQPSSQTGQPVAGTTPNYSASFTSAASSPAGAPTIQWEVSTDGGTNFSDLSGQTNSSLALTGLTSSDTGKRYRAKFQRSGWNTVRSSAATLTVPTDSITVTQQPSNTTASLSQFSSTAATLPSGNWNDVSYVNGKWFATPNDSLGGDYIATSNDGVTWTKRIAVLPLAGKWSKVLYGNGVYLTFLVSGTPAGTWAATSSDGATWTARQCSSTSSVALYGHSFLAGGGGWFFATQGSGGAVARWVQSQDGVDWSTLSNGAGYFDNVTASEDGTQLIGFSGQTSVAYLASVGSSGVVQFSSSATPLNQNLAAVMIVHAGGVFLASGFSGGTYVVSKYSESGSSWSSSLSSVPIVSIAYRNSRYVAATLFGLASSNDGLNWVLRQSGSGYTQDWSVATSSGFAGSIGGYLYTSPDGLTWTQRSSGGHLPLVAGDRVYVSNNSGFRQSGTIITPGGLLSASFSSAATTTFGSPDVQWQLSTDGGATWTDITDATSPTLSLTPVSADSGKRYRAVYTKASYTTVNSNSATLTVP